MIYKVLKRRVIFWHDKQHNQMQTSQSSVIPTNKTTASNCLMLSCLYATQDCLYKFIQCVYCHHDAQRYFRICHWHDYLPKYQFLRNFIPSLFDTLDQLTLLFRATFSTEFASRWFALKSSSLRSGLFGQWWNKVWTVGGHLVWQIKIIYQTNQFFLVCTWRSPFGFSRKNCKLQNGTHTIQEM